MITKQDIALTFRLWLYIAVVLGAYGFGHVQLAWFLLAVFAFHEIILRLMCVVILMRHQAGINKGGKVK